MHTRKKIIENQKLYEKHIIDWLKYDFKKIQKTLTEIEVPTNEDKKVKFIKNSQKKLLAKAKMVKIDKEIMNFFIRENNFYPKFYAWWDDELEEVTVYKYEDETR